MNHKERLRFTRRLAEVLTLASVSLAGCAGLEPVFAARLPGTGDCVSYGASVRVILPEGTVSKSAGCVEERPQLGMARPGH